MQIRAKNPALLSIKPPFDINLEIDAHFFNLALLGEKSKNWSFVRKPKSRVENYQLLPLGSQKKNRLVVKCVGVLSAMPANRSSNSLHVLQSRQKRLVYHNLKSALRDNFCKQVPAQLGVSAVLYQCKQVISKQIKQQFRQCLMIHSCVHWAE